MQLLLEEKRALSKVLLGKLLAQVVALQWKSKRKSFVKVVYKAVDGGWQVIEVSQPVAAASTAQNEAEADKGEEMELEDEQLVIVREIQKSGGMEVVRAMLRQINSRMGSLEARQSKLEHLSPKVKEKWQDNLQLLRQIIEDG